MSAVPPTRRRSKPKLKPRKTATSAGFLADLSLIAAPSILRTLLRRAVLGVSGISLFLIAPSTPAAQHADHVMTLPAAVNGAETPELISDQLAFRHFILAVVVPQNASDEDASRRDRVLKRVGLSSEDCSAFVRALQGLAEQLTANSEEAKRLSSQPVASSKNLDALRTQRLALLDIARFQVGTSLSASGRTKLDSYLRGHVKRRIVIYGEVPNEPLAQPSRSKR
jgi:hypothetical protein